MKSCEYEKFFGKKSKNQDKLIQSGTPKTEKKLGLFWQNLGSWNISSSN